MSSESGDKRPHINPRSDVGRCALMERAFRTTSDPHRHVVDFIGRVISVTTDNFVSMEPIITTTIQHIIHDVDVGKPFFMIVPPPGCMFSPINKSTVGYFIFNERGNDRWTAYLEGRDESARVPCELFLHP